ncbi:MAG: hypothetical protein PVH61_03650 [Candidatus Aminicenantes bacterium]
MENINPFGNILKSNLELVGNTPIVHLPIMELGNINLYTVDIY